MAAFTRLQTILRIFAGRNSTYSSPCQQSCILPGVASSRYNSTDANNPTLSVHPQTSLCDEAVDIKASGLSPGQLVTLKTQVYTENGKYRFESKAQYKADAEGEVRVQRDPSLGGSYEGVEPMGPILSLEPIPEIAHKYPRFVKWDVTKPFNYTLQLIEDGEDQTKVIASTSMEKNFLADYVERIPVTMGGAEGVLFLPKQRGSSDPLPFIIDIRGLLTNLVVDRAATLASHGFAVFAYDYFLPVRRKSQEKFVYIDAQSFIDIVDFVKEHPRLDENRIGMTSSCYGGAIMLNAATRLDLPIKCMVGAGFVDLLCVNVGWKNLDGSLLHPFGESGEYINTWTDEHGRSWMSLGSELKDTVIHKALESPDAAFCLEENVNCPLLLFLHEDDQHIPSQAATKHLRDRLKRAGKGHLLDFETLPGTGHFLEVPYQPINLVSSLYDPTVIQTPKLHFTFYGGTDTKQGVKDQVFAWGKIVNFFRKHLDVKEMYRSDWISS
ncbi:acyl-coenzyme A amino acid N-acyltransferase 2-like isoform X1 [Lytechinus variegatus]|uniref:acyl-coenzyme A amino acid N-acyltransferase 2-like isoform X1 n=1 Tax=Lytechinus variegatus TaxID=7654 RepID=UPI001BB1A429|nr:acyl-coenzyme A amino acid N-acyltransferase 2-like isoform X1 [Lytechinus variegatus]